MIAPSAASKAFYVVKTVYIDWIALATGFIALFYSIGKIHEQCDMELCMNGTLGDSTGNRKNE